MLLTLDSSSTNQKSHDYTIEYYDPIQTKDGYELALIKSNLWYSYYNVSTSLLNNTFQYTTNLAQVRTITIPNGNYTILQLNTYIHAIMKGFGDYTVVGGVDTFDLSIAPNYSTLRVSITLLNGYSINFTTSSFCLLLGWSSGIYNFVGTQDGQNTANINNGINSLLIHCDIIKESFQNNIQSDVLYTFVPDQPPGSNLEVYPKNELIYLPIKYDQVYKIRMYITDQLNRPIDLNNEPVTYLIHIRKKNNLFNPVIQNF